MNTLEAKRLVLGMFNSPTLSEKTREEFVEFVGNAIVSNLRKKYTDEMLLTLKWIDQDGKLHPYGRNATRLLLEDRSGITESFREWDIWYAELKSKMDAVPLIQPKYWALKKLLKSKMGL